MGADGRAKKKPVHQDGLRADRRRWVGFRLPAHARLAPARQAVVMVRMMVDAKDRHGRNLTATRGPVNVTARGMHDAGTLPTQAVVSGRIALTRHCE
jgi:hypothetical protein